MTRFYYELDWDGRELLLQSRADGRDRIRAARKAQLRKHRGVNSIYHNNGIQTWLVHKERRGCEMSRSLSCAALVVAAAAAGSAAMGPAAAPRSSRPCRASYILRAQAHGGRTGRDAGRDRRLGHRHPAGRPRPAGGQGTASRASRSISERCAACHGEFGESAGRWPILMGGAGTLRSHDPVKSIGSYWPYATTVMDYPPHDAVRQRAVLTNDELYAITAYVLYLNDVITDEKLELNERNHVDKAPQRAEFPRRRSRGRGTRVLGLLPVHVRLHSRRSRGHRSRAQST